MAAKRGTANLPVNYTEQLSREAQEIGKRLQGGGGSKIRANGNVGFRLPDGSETAEIEGIIVDFYAMNAFYDRPFDRDNPSPPACYALGEMPSTLAPPKDVPDRQAETCSVCPMNAFGSADNGKGKACRNKRILAIVPEEGAAEVELSLLDVPPGSVAKFDAYVAGLSAKHQTVPVGVVTKITLDKSQQYFSPRFEVVKPVDESALGAAFGRRDEARSLLSAAPDTSGYEAPKRKAAGTRR